MIGVAAAALLHWTYGFQTRLSSMLDTVAHLANISEALQKIKSAVSGCSSIVEGCHTEYSIWKQINASVMEVRLILRLGLYANIVYNTASCETKSDVTGCLIL